jgi:foldase protein PrsA
MAFCAAIATAVVLGACGGGVPGDAVAVVGSAPISKAAFDHWLLVANDATQGSAGTAAPPLPDPPSYSGCIAGERNLGSEAGATTAALKALCEQNYSSLKTEVMNYLIEALWIEGEAVDKGIKVTPAQVSKSYLAQRKTSKPSLATQAALTSFLARSGQTVADLKWRTYLSLVDNALLLSVQKKAAKVSTAAIDAYYHKHLSLLTTQATRDVHLIETKTEAAAVNVKKLLATGSTYATLAPLYSIDPSTKNVGGKLVGVRTGELNAQLSAALFAAKVGVVEGPLKTAFGYYVFTVDSATPAVVPTLAQAKAQIKTALTEANQTTLNAALQNDFTKVWPSRTTCAAGYLIASTCSNAPKTSSTSATGATTGATAATG